MLLRVTIYIDYVEIEGVKILRPSRISRREWLEIWEVRFPDA
jgi:hypothetical protein